MEGSSSGPVLIAFDGSGASEHAIREAGRLLGRRPALVLVVWTSGVGFEMMEMPMATTGLPAAPLDVRTAMDLDRAHEDRARQLAQHGADVAKQAGLDADGLAVAEDHDMPVAEAICAIARERDAAAIVVGAQGHGRLASAFLGSTSRDVIRHAGGRPVIVVRSDETG